MKSLSKKINESLNEDSKAYGESNSYSEFVKNYENTDYFLVDKKSNKIVASYATYNIPKPGQKAHMDKNHQLISRTSAKKPAPYLDQTPLDYDDKKNWVNEDVNEAKLEFDKDVKASFKHDWTPSSGHKFKKGDNVIISINFNPNSNFKLISVYDKNSKFISYVETQHPEQMFDINESLIVESPSHPTKLEIVKTLYGTTDDKDFYQWSTTKSDTPWIVKPGDVFTIDSTQKISGKQYLDYINSKDGRESFEIDLNQLETLIRKGVIKEIFGFNEDVNEDKKVPTSFLASKLIYFSRIMKSSGIKKQNAIRQYLVDGLALDTDEANTLSELLLSAESSDKDDVTKLLDKWKIDTSVIRKLEAINESIE